MEKSEDEEQLTAAPASSLSSWPGPRTVFLHRTENGFGFTLRHFIVYPPEAFKKLDDEHSTGRNESPVLPVTSCLEPMDTIFVKHVKEGGPAHQAGLSTGDRIVSVNGETITGKSYSHVVQLIQKSGSSLQLLVVPKEDDILQLYFPGTAYHVGMDGQPAPGFAQGYFYPSSKDLQQSKQHFLHGPNAASSSSSNFKQLKAEARPVFGSFRNEAEPWILNESHCSGNSNYTIYSRLGSTLDQCASIHPRSVSSVSHVQHHANGNMYGADYARSKSATDLSPPLGQGPSFTYPQNAGITDHASNQDGARSLQTFQVKDSKFRSYLHPDSSQECCSKSLPSYSSFMVSPQQTMSSPKYSQATHLTADSLYTSSGSFRSSGDPVLSREKFLQICTADSSTTPTTSSISSREASAERFGLSDGLTDRMKTTLEKKEEFLRSSPHSDSSKTNMFHFNENLATPKEYCAQPQKLGRVMWPPTHTDPMIQRPSVSTLRPLESEPHCIYYTPARTFCYADKSFSFQNQNLYSSVQSSQQSLCSNSDSSSSNFYSNGSSAKLFEGEEYVDASSEDSIYLRNSKPFYCTLDKIQENIATNGSCINARSHRQTKATSVETEDTGTKRFALPPLRKANSLDSDVPSSNSARPGENRRIMQLQLVSQRTKQFESGSVDSEARNRMNLYRNELSRLTAKGQTTSVSARAAIFESRSTSQETVSSEGDLVSRQRNSLEFKREGSREFRWQRSYSDNVGSSDSANSQNNYSNHQNNSGVNLTISAVPSSVHSNATKTKEACEFIITDDEDDDFPRRRAVRQNSYLQAVRSPYRESSTKLSPSSCQRPTQRNVPNSLAIALERQPVVPQEGSIPAPPTPSNGLGSETGSFASEHSLLHELRSTDFGSLFEEGSISRLIAAFDNMLAGTTNKAKSTLPYSSNSTQADNANSGPVTSLGGVVLRKKAIYEDELHGTRSTSYLKATSTERMHGESDNEPGEDDQADGKIGTPGGSRSHSIQKLKAFFGEKTPQIIEATEKRVIKEVPSPVDEVVKEGWLQCKTAFLDGKRATDRSWKQLYGCYKNNVLHLFKDKKDAQQLPLCLEEQPMVLIPTNIEVAIDYTKKKNVFRLNTSNGSEYLLQAEDHDDMSQWIHIIQDHLTANAQINGGQHLVIRKYEQLSRDHSSRLSPQPVQKGIKKLTSFRNRSPTGQSPISKNRKSTHNEDFSPKAKTWRGKMVKTIKKMHGSAPVSPIISEGVTITVPLEDCPPSSVSEYVPLLVELCVSIVEARGLEMVGIYRVPGNTAAVTALMEAVNRGFDDLDLQDSRWNDINVISSLLKAFFRKLPEPLIPSDLYPFFIDANKIEDRSVRISTLKKLLHELPVHHYETLKYLIKHLRNIVDHCSANKMEARNLAIVFGPTLVRAMDDNMVTMVTDMSHQCCIVEALITKGDWFFNDEDNYDFSDQNVSSAAELERKQPNDSKEQDISRPTKDVCAKDIVASIITAAKRKVQERAKKMSVCSAPPLGEDAGFEERNIDREVELRRLRVQRHQDSLDPSSSGGSGNQRPSSAETRTGQHTFSKEATTPKRTVSADSLNNLQMQSQINEIGSQEFENRLFVPQGSAKRSPSHESLVLSSEKMGDEVVFRTYSGLSAITQERIKRFEMETRALLQRDWNRQQKENERRQQEKHRIEMEWQRAKRDLEQDDLLDALADTASDFSSRGTDRLAGRTSLLAHQKQHDTSSVTSDYSTLSSNAALEILPIVPSQSSSDYSNNTSPIIHRHHFSTNLNSTVPKTTVTSDYNSNNSSPLSTSSSDRRTPTQLIQNRNATSSCGSLVLPGTLHSVQKGASADSAQLLKEQGLPESPKSSSQTNDGVLSPSHLQRSPSARCGSLDSLREFYDAKEGNSCASSEDSSDLLSSITSSLNQRLRVLFDPNAAVKAESTTAQLGVHAAKEETLTSNPVTPQAERKKRYRDPSLHRTRDPLTASAELVSSAQNNGSTTTDKSGRREPKRSTSVPPRSGERKTGISELKLTVDGKRIKPVNSLATSTGKQISSAEPKKSNKTGGHESRSKRSHLRVDIKKNKEAEKKPKQNISDSSPVDVQFHRNENTLITATVSTTKHTVTSSTTTAVITSTIISKSEKTRSNLKDRAKDQSKRSLAVTKSIDQQTDKPVDKTECGGMKCMTSVTETETNENKAKLTSVLDGKGSSSPPVLPKSSAALRNLKRRHTVGGTKDFENFRVLLCGYTNRKDDNLSAWERLQPVVQEQTTLRSMKTWLERERLRTSSPDLVSGFFSSDECNTADLESIKGVQFSRQRRISFPEAQLASVQLSKIVTLESQV